MTFVISYFTAGSSDLYPGHDHLRHDQEAASAPKINAVSTLLFVTVLLLLVDRQRAGGPAGDGQPGQALSGGNMDFHGLEA